MVGQLFQRLDRPAVLRTGQGFPPDRSAQGAGGVRIQGLGEGLGDQRQGARVGQLRSE